jgi:hypothetical protein
VVSLVVKESTPTSNVTIHSMEEHSTSPPCFRPRGPHHKITIITRRNLVITVTMKGLEELSILHKNFCNMHIARRNMHIATESILRLTRTQIINSTKKCKVALLRRKLLSKSTSTYLCFSYTLRVPTVAMGTLSVPYVILLFYLLVGQTLGSK